MVNCFLLDSNDIRDFYFHQKSLYLTKNAAPTLQQLQKTNIKNSQQTVLNCQLLSNEQLL